MRKKWALILAISLIALSITCSILFYRYDKQVGHLLTNWPTTQGSVLFYEKEWWPSTDQTWIYVEYTYELNGKQYFAKQEWMWNASANEYSQGQTLEVYFNPEKPEMSAIEPIQKSPNWVVATLWVYLGSGIVTLCAIAIFWLNRGQPW
jgi:hypothetical protein